MTNSSSENITTREAKTAFYVIEVQGFAPEFFTGVAFRKKIQPDIASMKEIHCPQCKRFYTHIGKSVKVQIHVYPSKKGIRCHELRKCRICHSEIGINFLLSS